MLQGVLGQLGHVGMLSCALWQLSATCWCPVLCAVAAVRHILVYCAVRHVPCCQVSATCHTVRCPPRAMLSAKHG